MFSARAFFFGLIAGVFVFGDSSFAQQASATVPGGTVTGHVLCGDTRLPARFGGVMLLAVPKDVSPAPKLDDNASASQVAAAMKSAMGGMSIVQTQTGMDGSFTANNVVPGDYYVFASVAGYVQPTNIVQAALDSGADLSKAIPGVPMVHVVAERSAQADVTIDRGAAISGRVVWDDGAPVAHAIVSAISTSSKADKKLPPQFGMLAVSSGVGGGGLVSISDDLGHFRLAGLGPGDYVVKAMFLTNTQFAMQGGVMNLNAGTASTPLTIYAPATFHKAEAKAVTLHTAEDRGDEEVTIKLSGLRTVSGRVASLEDHHGLNSGTVKLEDARDKEFTRSASVDANGSFSVTFVPPGTYNLTVSGGADTEPSKKEPTGLLKFSMNHTLRSYEVGKQSVIVGDNDVTGLSIELAPAKTTTKDLDLNELIKE